MIGVALGLAFLVPAASARKDFRRRHPYMADFHTDEERSQASRQTTWEQVCGLAVILLDVAIASAASLIWGWSNQVRGCISSPSWPLGSSSWSIRVPAAG